MAIDYSALNRGGGGTNWQNLNTGLAQFASSFPTPQETYQKKKNAYFSGMSNQIIGNFEFTGDGYQWKNAATGNNSFDMKTGDQAWNDWNNTLKADPNYSQFDRRGLIDPLSFNQDYAKMNSEYAITMLDKVMGIADDGNLDAQGLRSSLDKSPGMSSYIQNIMHLLNSQEVAARYTPESIDKLKSAMQVGGAKAMQFGGWGKAFGGEGYGAGPLEYGIQKTFGERPVTSTAVTAGALYGGKKLYNYMKNRPEATATSGSGKGKGKGKGTKKTSGKGTTKGKGTGKGSKSILTRVKDFLTKERKWPENTPGEYDKYKKIAKGDIGEPDPKKRRGRPPLPPREKLTNQLRREAEKILSKGGVGEDLTPNQRRALTGEPIKGTTTRKKKTIKTRSGGRKNSKKILDDVKKKWKKTKTKGWKTILQNAKPKDIKAIVGQGLKATGGYYLTDTAVQGVLDAAGAGKKTKGVTSETMQIAAKTGAHRLVYDKIKKHGVSKILKTVAQKGGIALAGRTLGKYAVGGVAAGTGVGAAISVGMWAWAAKDVYDIYTIISEMD